MHPSATLIMLYRISKRPAPGLAYEQAKVDLMGENAEDSLLFIVTQLLRDDDAELRCYLQHPHILVSSLLKLKQEFVLGDGNIIRLFQQAREACDQDGVARLTMKQFSALYEEMDPSVRRDRAVRAASKNKGEEDEQNESDERESEQKEEEDESEEEKERQEEQTNAAADDRQEHEIRR